MFGAVLSRVRAGRQGGFAFWGENAYGLINRA